MESITPLTSKRPSPKANISNYLQEDKENQNNFNKSDDQRELERKKNRFDEFKKKVQERKLRGFNGREYTLVDAMSKQFGPEAVDARAFLEYYWEMKASCLEAVEKGRDEEVEKFKSHPLFSPYWLLPSKKDLRWQLKNKITADSVGNETRLRSKIPVRVNNIKVESLSRHPTYPLPKKIDAVKNLKRLENKNENRTQSKIPVKLIVKPTLKKKLTQKKRTTALTSNRSEKATKFGTLLSRKTIR